jgi:uncharacterized membrane protein HdeD (DUF308 family)
MLAMMTANWWAIALRGVLAVLFGVLLFVWPAAGLAVLVALFGAYALVDGVFALISAFRAGERWWGFALEGIVGIAAGVLTFLWPDITAIVLLYLIAFWAIATGVFEIMAAIRLRREIDDEWLLGLVGVLSILFGAYLVFFPAAGALTVVWIVAAYAVMFGVLLVMLGLRLRGLGEGTRRPAAAA